MDSPGAGEAYNGALDFSSKESDIVSYYSQRSLVPLYSEEKQCHWPGYCKACLVVVLIILLVWGVVVPIYFVFGPGLRWFHESEETNIHGAFSPRMSATGLSGHRPVLHTANGTFAIVNEVYVPDLDNPTSPKYQVITAKLETLLQVALQYTSHFKQVHITGLSPGPGSVVVQFLVTFKMNKTRVWYTVKQCINAYLEHHQSYLGPFHVDMRSLQVTEIYDPCEQDSGGCSHRCSWNLVNNTVTCHCPMGYSLATDFLTCKSLYSKKPKLCSSGTFECYEGDCIPHKWLCDGFADCLLGEDEEQDRCETHRRLQNKTKNVSNKETEKLIVATNSTRIEASTVNLTINSTQAPNRSLNSTQAPLPLVMPAMMVKPPTVLPVNVSGEISQTNSTEYPSSDSANSKPVIPKVLWWFLNRNSSGQSSKIAKLNQPKLEQSVEFNKQMWWFYRGKTGPPEGTTQITPTSLAPHRALDPTPPPTEHSTKKSEKTAFEISHETPVRKPQKRALSVKSNTKRKFQFFG